VRFELIDQVVERHPDRLVALKNVTCAEEYLADHFPGFPVLPGVMMLETLVQAARLLAEPTAGLAPLVLAEVRNVRYGNMVRPGECLKVEVTLKARDPKLGWEFSGVGTVNEQMAVQGKFRLALLET
jgi:3-hydroxyacyl-[acyl-carrier-protein] dehydratase